MDKQNRNASLLRSFLFVFTIIIIISKGPTFKMVITKSNFVIYKGRRLQWRDL